MLEFLMNYHKEEDGLLKKKKKKKEKIRYQSAKLGMLLIWKFHCAPKNWRHLCGSIFFFLLFFFFVCPVPLEDFRQQISKLWSIVGSHFPTPDSSLTEPIQRARAPFVTYTSTLVNIRVTTAYKRYRIITWLKRHWNGRLTSFVSLITLYVRHERKGHQFYFQVDHQWWLK